MVSLMTCVKLPWAHLSSSALINSGYSSHWLFYFIQVEGTSSNDQNTRKNKQAVVSIIHTRDGVTNFRMFILAIAKLHL